MPRLPDDCDPYLQKTPYDYLGVEPAAKAKDVRTAFANLENKIRNSGKEASQRAREQQELQSQYDQVSAGGRRVRVDFFLLDSSLGQKRCQAVAASIPKPDTQIADVVKPRKIRVTHDALLEDLERFLSEPPRVEGLHARPMPVHNDRPLPEPLAIQFDC